MRSDATQLSAAWRGVFVADRRITQNGRRFNGINAQVKRVLSELLGRRRRRPLITVAVVVLVVDLIGASSIVSSANQLHAASSRQRTVVDPDPPYAVKAGWGPDRKTFTMNSPSPDVTLNAITDNPGWGDERNFFQVKSVGDPNAKYTKTIREKGRYTALIFFENSAAPGRPAATNVRVSMQFPATVTGSGRLNGIVTAANASPPAVWDSVVLTLPNADDSVALRIVQGSAVLHTGGKSNGAAIDLDQLLSDQGALVGCDRLDGVVTGEGKCEGWVTADFVTAYPDFTVQAWLGTPHQNDFGGDKTIRPGDTLTVKMTYKNTGTVDQDNVVLDLASRPMCSTVIPGSTWISSSATDGHWLKIGDDIDVGHPLNVGDYGPDGNVYLKFDVHFCDQDELIRQYSGHDWSRGALWTEPYLTVAADTANGSKSAAPLLVTILGPTQH
jgi:hypothetical protein